MRRSHNALQPSQLLALFLAGHVTSSNHMGLSSFKEGFSIQLTHIMLVNPVQLIDIENCRILSYAVHGELFNQLLHAEDFLLAIGSPAQQSQEIVDAGGQIAQLTILVHTGSAMALAHLGVVLAQNQGNMTKGGLLKAQCIINQALARSVGQMLLSTDYMGNVHQSIVDYYGIVIGGDAIGFNDNKITDIIGIKYYIATHHIAHQDLLISGHAEAHGRLATFSLKLSDLLGSQIAAFTHVARHFTSLNQGLALLLQLFISAIAIVCLALSQQLVGIFFVNIQTLHLMVGAIGAAHINALIPVHAQPLQSSLDVFLGFRGGTLSIGIFNTQNQLAAGFASQQPVEQGATSAANMERAGRARCKSYSYFFIITTTTHLLFSLQNYSGIASLKPVMVN